MIINRLKPEEFEKIIKTVIRLDNTETVKRTIYKFLHFSVSNPTEKSQYRINSQTHGVKSTYRGFEVKIHKLDDPINDFTGTVIQFHKNKKFPYYYMNQNQRMVKILKKTIESEISDLSYTIFDSLYQGIVPHDDKKHEFQYQSGTLNPDWKRKNLLSPLTIFQEETPVSFLTEFIFIPECYERKLDKTVLRDNWLGVFDQNIHTWF